MVNAASIARQIRHHLTAAQEEWLAFFQSWLRAPHRIGAIAPSSRFLARAIARQVDLSGTDPIVELGAGTGNVTKALLHEGIPADRLIVLERDPLLCKLLRRRFPQLRIIEGDAAELRALLAPLGITRLAAVVSSLPLLAMPRSVRRAIIDEAFALLGAEGHYVQFTYGLGRLLGEEEDLHGTREAFVLLNLPPASVWRFRQH